MYNVGMNSGYNNTYFRSDKKNPIKDLPGGQPLAGLVTPPKTPKKKPKHPLPPIAGKIAPQPIPKTPLGKPPIMAGSINIPDVYDRPGYKPDGTPIDPEKAQEVINKILGRNINEVA